MEHLRDRCNKLLVGEAEGDTTTEKIVQEIKCLKRNGVRWWLEQKENAVLALRDTKSTFLQANETMDEGEKTQAKQLYNEAIKRLREVQNNDR